MLDWIFVTEATKALKERRQERETWQQGLLRVFNYIENNKSFVINVYNSIGRDHFEQYINKVIRHLLIEVIDQECKELYIPQENKTFIINFYTYAFLGMVLDWMRQKMEESPEELVAKLHKLIQGQTKSSLEKFAKN